MRMGMVFCGALMGLLSTPVEASTPQEDGINDVFIGGAFFIDEEALALAKSLEPQALDRFFNTLPPEWHKCFSPNPQDTLQLVERLSTEDGPPLEVYTGFCTYLDTEGAPAVSAFYPGAVVFSTQNPMDLQVTFAPGTDTKQCDVYVTPGEEGYAINTAPYDPPMTSTVVP